MTFFYLLKEGAIIQLVVLTNVEIINNAMDATTTKEGTQTVKKKPSS
ncbi:hypothetical protein [Tenacibaculum maritimum]